MSGFWVMLWRVQLLSCHLLPSQRGWSGVNFKDRPSNRGLLTLTLPYRHPLARPGLSEDVAGLRVSPPSLPRSLATMVRMSRRPPPFPLQTRSSRCPPPIFFGNWTLRSALPRRWGLSGVAGGGQAVADAAYAENPGRALGVVAQLAEGSIPVKRLLPNWSTRRLVISPNSPGISPDSWFPLELRYSNLPRLPS